MSNTTSSTTLRRYFQAPGLGECREQHFQITRDNTAIENALLEPGINQVTLYWHRAGGKTTRIRQISQSLTRKGFKVIQLDATTYENMKRELWPAVMEEIFAALGRPFPKDERWDTQSVFMWFSSADIIKLIGKNNLVIIVDEGDAIGERAGEFFSPFNKAINTGCHTDSCLQALLFVGVYSASKLAESKGSPVRAKKVIAGDFNREEVQRLVSGLIKQDYIRVAEHCDGADKATFDKSVELLTNAVFERSQGYVLHTFFLLHRYHRHRHRQQRSGTC